MKIKNSIIGLAALSIIVSMGFIQTNNSKFYYSNNEKIIITELDNKLIVRYKKNKKSDRTQLSLNLELANKPKI